MAVFKGDYPRDDKSIADDEWSDRSRVSESSGTHRKSISDGRKCGREINEDGETSGFIDDNFKHQTGMISDTYDDHVVPKIRRKRISRGVQHNVSAGQRRGNRFFIDYFRSRSKKKRHNSPEEIREREILKSKKIIEILPRNKENASLIEKVINDMRFKNHRNSCDNEKEKYPGNTILEMSEDKRNNHKVKKSSFGRFITILTCKNIPKIQQYIPSTDPSNNKREIIESKNSENSPRSEYQTDVFYHNQSNNAAVASADVNSEDESDVNEAKKKLDCCIAELNEIISDACVIFGSKGAQCRSANTVRVTRVCE